jgi:glutaredoxin 3
MTMSSDPTEFAKAEIASNDIMVFSKSFCPFCKKTKKLLDGMNLPYTAIELDEIANGDAVQAALLDISGQRTVPNVFIKGVHLGGNDDTQAAAKSGKLQEMLK